jgi:hypothetical protein
MSRSRSLETSIFHKTSPTSKTSVSQPVSPQNRLQGHCLMDRRSTPPVNGTSTYGTLVQGIWFNLGGTNLDITGSTNVTQGWIHCMCYSPIVFKVRLPLTDTRTSNPPRSAYGQAWWDANNSTGLANRPHLMTYNVTGGTMRNLKLRKPIAW